MEEEKTIYQMECRKRTTEKYSKRFKVLLGASVITGVLLSLAGAGAVFVDIVSQIWKTQGWYEISWEILIEVIMICSTVVLIKISLAEDERPFSKGGIWGVRVIGISMVVCSFLFPILNGSSTFFVELKHWNLGVELELLLPGLLILVLGELLKAGVRMQGEIEEIL